MESKSVVTPRDAAIDRLQKIRLFVGTAPAFWTEFTEAAQALTNAIQARSMVKLEGR